MKEAGMAEEQMVAAKPTADLQIARGADDAVSAQFVRKVYQTAAKR
jgi:hypothetical protein